VPAAETARLLASLELQDKFSKTADTALRKTGQLESRFDNIGSRASKGVGVAAANIARIGAVAAVSVAGAIGAGIRSLAELETAVTSVDGAIDTLGLTGKLTGKQVAEWANDIERDVGAAFDDKAITAAAATLLRFGKVTPQNLRPALTVMTDLAAKTGSIESASELLAKALADPEKAAGKLARTGVVLTKSQQDQIKAMVKAGDVAGAQALLIAELDKATRGAALASQGPMAQAMAKLKDAGEDATKALAIGLLPVITKVADRLSKAVSDPQTLKRLEEFGQRLAGAFDKALVFAEKIPWNAIGTGLQTAATWAGKLFDVFRSLPPEMQATLVALAGLNKLSGGAIGGIVGELGKGLIKGVLGMTAGVVNINAGVVNGGGVPGVPGAAPAAGAAAGVSAIASAAGAAAGAGVIAGLTEKILSTFKVAPVLEDLVSEIGRTNGDIGAAIQNVANRIIALEKAKTAPPTPLIPGGARTSAEGGWGPTLPAKIGEEVGGEVVPSIESGTQVSREQILVTKITAAQRHMDEVFTRAATVQGLERVGMAQRIGDAILHLDAIFLRATMAAGFSSLTGAVNNLANRPQPPVFVTVNSSFSATVSARTTMDAQRTSTRYGVGTSGGGIRAM
jgi:hypothetical protein